MPVLILLLSFGLSTYLFVIYQNNIRAALLKAILILYIKIVLITEVLSIFNWLEYSLLLTAWSIIILIDLSLLYYAYVHKINRANEGTTKNDQQKPLSQKINLLILSLISFVFVVSLFVALKTPPNTFDSMTYHMPRVSHWIQNQSVKFFPTGNSRQNFSMPLAEYAILQAQILSRSDRFANMIQWISFVMVVGITTLIAKELKVDIRGQLLTGLLAATLPMGILQSSTTQNDLVVAMFCLSFLYFFILLNKELSYTNGIFAGISMGLAFLTKGTGYIFCAAVGIVYGLSLLVNNYRNKQLLKSTYIILIIISIPVLINFGHLSRSYRQGQDPFLEVNKRTIVDRISFINTGSNLLRNSAIHLASPIYSINQSIETIVVNILGAQNKNPDSTFENSGFSVIFYINEDYSGNLLHFVLISFGILISPWLLVSKKLNLDFFLLILVSIILFSLLLKWQPWSSRLQTAIFYFGIVFIGLYASKLVRSHYVIMASVVLLFFFSLPYLLLSSPRPVMPVLPKTAPIKTTRPYLYLANKVDKYLINHPHLDEIVLPIKHNFSGEKSIILTDRSELYFFANKEYYKDYLNAVDVLKSIEPEEVGLVLGSNDWEYPIWVLTNRHATAGTPLFQHVLIDKYLGEFSGEDIPIPDILIVTIDTETEYFNGNLYGEVYVSPSIRILSIKQ